MIAQLIKEGGEIEITKKGLLETVYSFLVGSLQIAELCWEKKALSNQAFYTTTDTRYEITAPSALKPTVHIKMQGCEVATLKYNRLFNRGSIVTNEAHLFTFKRNSLQRKTVVKREAGLQVIFTLTKTGLRGHRSITVEPSELSVEEFHGLMAAIVFHLIRKERG